MLRCKKYYAAMQTNGLFLVSGMPILANMHFTKGDNTMSKTASLGFAPSATLFGRLLLVLDRLLMANARIAVRNGDLPYFGL